MGLKIELHGLFEDNRRTEFQWDWRSNKQDGKWANEWYEMG